MEHEERIDKIFTIPNLLSFARILLVPFIVMAYFYAKEYYLAGILVIVSGATDVIDGFIARKFHMISKVGKILDPIADKLTQVAVLVCLASSHIWMLLPVGLMVVKEGFMLVSGYFVVKKANMVYSAEWHGKVATVCLYLTMGMHLFWLGITSLASYISIGISSFMIFLSLIFYGLKNIKIIKEYKRQKEEQVVSDETSD